MNATFETKYVALNGFYEIHTTTFLETCPYTFTTQMIYQPFQKPLTTKEAHLFKKVGRSLKRINQQLKRTSLSIGLSFLNIAIIFADFSLECAITNSIIYVQSSRPEVFCKEGVLRNFKKFTGKRLCQSLFFNKVAKCTRKKNKGFFFLFLYLCLFLYFSKVNSFTRQIFVV